MPFFRRSVSLLGAHRLPIPLLLSAVLTVCLLIVPAPAATPDSTVLQQINTTPLDPAIRDSLLGIRPIITSPDTSTILKINNPNLPPSDWVTPAGDSTVVLETFDYPRFLNTYPDGIWEGRSGRFYRKTRKVDVYYNIQKEDNNYYLAASTEGEAVNFGREVKITYRLRGRERETGANLRLHQKLRWRWRVHSLPQGSDENDSDKNDSAAAVRLLFGTGVLSGKSLKYIWSETLPKGTIIESSRQYVIVVRSGPKNLGEWVWEEVNAYEDYRRLFGGDPRPVDGLGLLTDSNNTDTFVKADYDDITFIIPRPAVEMVPDFMLENPE